MISADDPEHHVPGLDPSVAERIVAELGETGERVLRCLRTAHTLLESSREDVHRLRYAESAAYNVRESLDSVVRDHPAGEGGLASALDAWNQYKLTCALPGADELTARARLAEAMDGLARDRQRQAYMTRRLLDWFQHQTGLAPISGAGDPTAQYQRLRDSASTVLHGDASPDEVLALLNDTLAWFTRFFAPPSDIAGRIEQLAALPFTADRLIELRNIVMNAHHLRLFLQRIEDPNWLEPMRQVDLIGLPATSEVWPVNALTADGHRLPRTAVAELLSRLAADLKTIPREARAACAFEIVRAALWLGASGQPIVVELLRRFPNVESIQSIAMLVTREMDATDPALLAVADAVVGNEPRHDRGYWSREILDRLVEGLNEQNVDERFSLIAVKLRNLARAEPYLAFDIVALSTDGVDEFEYVLDVAQRLAAMIPRTRTLGLSSAAMIERLTGITGELGERLTCQVLAGAADVDRKTKLSHLAARFASLTATGDDRVLLDDVLPLDDDDIALLRNAFGQPPSIVPNPEHFDDDSARAWRWAMVLPPSILEGWDDAIAVVSAKHGAPDPSALNRRTSMFGADFGGSPIATEDISALDPLSAAALIAAWRPGPADRWGVSARELARTLESAVKDAPAAWAEDPVEIVRTLREPVYVDHYFRALTASAAEVGTRAPELITAFNLVREQRWDPAIIGNDDFDFEPDWTLVDSVGVELIGALADANADLASDLDLCWQLATELAGTLPARLGSAEDFRDTTRHDDPLHHAINSSYGKGLQAVLALGGWEHRNLGTASERLAPALSKALTVDGAVGLQLRAVIAATRPFVETIAAEWFEQNQGALFGDALGQITLDQTLKYSRPTKEFYDLSRDRLLSAARRGASHAVAWLLIAYLRDEPGYSFDDIVDGLTRHHAALAEMSGELARLCIGVPDDQAEMLQRGLRFWNLLLAEAGTRVPAAALEGLGRWALGTNIDPAIWLEMTERTVMLTGGPMASASEVAERCRDLQPSSTALRVLVALLGHGAVWDQHHIDGIAVEALKSAANAGLADAAFNDLRERLIQRGRHDARSIFPS